MSRDGGHGSPTIGREPSLATGGPPPPTTTHSLPTVAQVPLDTIRGHRAPLESVAAGDLDGDGAVDLALAHREGNNVGFLLGDGTPYAASASITSSRSANDICCAFFGSSSTTTTPLVVTGRRTGTLKSHGQAGRDTTVT
jgi:hypothetical protein